jgi:hypothetical protein
MFKYKLLSNSVAPCGRTDGHDEANSRFFRNFANVKMWIRHQSVREYFIRTVEVYAVESGNCFQT